MKKGRQQLYRKVNGKPKRSVSIKGASLWDFLRGIEATDHGWRARIGQSPRDFS